MVSAILLMVDISFGYVNRATFCSFVNTSLDYYIYLKETYANQLGAKWRNGCEEILLALRAVMFIMPFLLTIQYFQHPERPIYTVSLLPPSDSLFYTFFAHIGYGIFLFLLQISSASTILGFISPTLGIIFCFMSIIEEMKAGRKVYRMKPGFRKPENLRILVRIMQLLSTQINVISRQVIMAEQTLITYTGTICIFSAIRFWGQLSISATSVLILTAISAVGLWTMVITVSAHTYTNTEKALNTWRNYTNWSAFEKLQMKKFRKSVRPIQLEFGGFYYIRPKKILTFCNTMVWLVVRCLLTISDTHNNHGIN
ncbi:hypothetical protein Fcan01_06991 [Folsomia candida]|uniref:Uncharacterized protein n=2 Tax=Folsomia candida TaxID=158441 RepID=A0A226EME5_FOLCA|nr:hypothetical protein Fcan01_06991 [Folsomia candida]